MSTTTVSALQAALRCPVSRLPLAADGEALVCEDRSHRYTVTDSGIPLFAENFLSREAQIQQRHYDRVAEQYLRNLGFPHTQEYTRYMDEEFLRLLPPAGDPSLRHVAEICCGRGEAIHLLKDRIGSGVGIDVSAKMLEAARRESPEKDRFLFIQGDATRVPLADSCVDSVFIFGGIHHVPDRQALFSEIFRILKPGGRFYFREPLSDFILWRAIRAVIYRASPALDAETERPLLKSETLPPLENAGFRLREWRTYGFFGFCFFMNSDILIFNRLFRFIPGIRVLTRLATRLDDLTLKLPGMKGMGLQVAGVAEKPLP